MSGTTPFWKQRQIWAIAVGLASLSAWIVGLGAGIRGWLLEVRDLGIVAHAQAFGIEAFIWWIPASILTLTAVVIGIGAAIVRHLVDDPIKAVPEAEPVEPVEDDDTTVLRAEDDGPGAGPGGKPDTDPLR